MDAKQTISRQETEIYTLRNRGTMNKKGMNKKKEKERKLKEK